MSETATVKRPDWTQIKQATRVWSEDDVTVGQSDHETVDRAFMRIYGVQMLDPLETWDDGDSFYKRLPMGIVVIESFPGNSGIVARSYYPEIELHGRER